MSNLIDKIEEKYLFIGKRTLHTKNPRSQNDYSRITLRLHEYRKDDITPKKVFRDVRIREPIFDNKEFEILKTFKPEEKVHVLFYDDTIIMMENLDTGIKYKNSTYQNIFDILVKMPARKKNSELLLPYLKNFRYVLVVSKKDESGKNVLCDLKGFPRHVETWISELLDIKNHLTETIDNTYNGEHLGAFQYGADNVRFKINNCSIYIGQTKEKWTNCQCGKLAYPNRIPSICVDHGYNKTSCCSECLFEELNLELSNEDREKFKIQ